MTIERELTHNLREVLGEGENHNQKASQCYYTLAATTGDTYSGNIVDTNSKEVLSEAGQRAAEKEDIPTRRRRTWPNGDESNCFRSAQWSDDAKNQQRALLMQILDIGQQMGDTLLQTVRIVG